MQADKVKLPSWYKQIWDALIGSAIRRIVLYGGRGSAKSTTVATVILLLMMRTKLRVLCAREIQKSINDSVKKLLDDVIEKYGWQDYFESTQNIIRAKNGGEIIFVGLWPDASKIKSFEGIDIVWVEEAQTISSKSLEVLIPTIRKKGSKLIFTFNPLQESDPVYDYVKNPRDNSLVLKVNYYDNPFFNETELVEEMEWDKINRPEMYQHTWEGLPVVNTDAQIFKGCWSIGVCPHKPEGVPYYQGADWGFAKDPIAMMRSWIDEQKRKLYIDAAITKVGVEIVDTPAFFDRIDTARQYRIRADNARPEMISHMKNAGFDIVAVEKGKGSIESGISFLKSYDIIVSPELTNYHQELTFYSYKVDKKTGNILPDIVDDWNHLLDSTRYAYEPLIKAKSNKVSTMRINPF